MKHLANMYLTPTTKVNWPEGTIIDYLALDRVKINNGIYPPGGLLSSWQYLNDSVISDEWRVLPKLNVGERYQARFKFKAEGFWVSFGIIFLDSNGKTIEDFYSATSELNFTVPDGYVNYQIGLYGHGSGTVEFNKGELLSVDEHENSEIGIDWMLEQQSEPRYLLINFEQPTLHVTAVDYWQASLPTVPGVILHVTDNSPLLTHLILDEIDTFELLQNELCRLIDRWHLNKNQIFVSGLGIAARVARAFGHKVGVTTILADPLVGATLPLSIDRDMRPLVEQQRTMFDIATVDGPATLLLADFDSHKEVIKRTANSAITIEMCHDPEQNKILNASPNYQQYYQLQFRNWVLKHVVLTE